MLRFTEIFRIRKEERKGVLAALAVFCLLNAANVVRYWTTLTAVGGNTWKQFIHGWHLSGFDPITYAVVTDWSMGYNVYRHPLLAYFMWPLSMVNKALTAATGVNLAIVIVALLLTTCSVYSFVFLTRIYNIIGVSRRDGYWLTAMTFSFAYIMLATFAPDHFIISMMMLTMTLYVAGYLAEHGGKMSGWQTLLLFVFTAGVSLNNGIKVFLAALFSRGRHFFRPRFILLYVIIPAALMWAGARLSYRQFLAPKYIARMEKTEKSRIARINVLRQRVADTIKTKDTALIAAAADTIFARETARKEARKKRSALYRHTGKPLMDGEFMGWTDITTSRTDAVVENLFGEGLMIHENYLLADVLIKRPVVVRYVNWFNYIVEAIVVALFLIGVWMGRRSRFMWMAMSFLLLDILLHVGLGFGINEIYIMSAHYLFILPIAMAFAIKNCTKTALLKVLRTTIAAVTLYLWTWNIVMLAEYMC